MGGPPAPVLVCHSTLTLFGGAVATATSPDWHGSYTVVPDTAGPPSTSPPQNAATARSSWPTPPRLPCDSR